MRSKMGRRGIPKLRMELISNEKARFVTFQKRRKCLEKKAYELSTLCGVEACVIVYGPKLKDQHRPIDQPEIWPKDPDAIRRMFISYKERSDEDRCKRTLDLSDLFEDDPKKKKKKKAEKTKYPSWDDSYNGLSEEQLRVFGTILEEKLQAVKTRVQFLKGNNPKLQAVKGSTMMDSFLATQATTQNHSYFLQSEEAIHEQQQQPISLVNLQRELDMPVYYPPFDLSMPNSMMKMDDKDCNIIGLGDASSGTGNVRYSITPTNSSAFYDSTCGILENVIMDNPMMPPPMCYYDPTLQPNMLSSMPNLMTMMMMNMDDTDDCIGLGTGVSGSNFTYYNTPMYDPMSHSTVENVIMDNPMPPPMCYYGPGQHDVTGHELSGDLNSSILYAC